jgi:hypothetical protein
VGVRAFVDPEIESTYAISCTFAVSEGYIKNLMDAADYVSAAFVIFNKSHVRRLFSAGAAVNFYKQAKSLSDGLKKLSKISNNNRSKIMLNRIAKRIWRNIVNRYDAYPDRTSPKETNPLRGAGAISRVLKDPSVMISEVKELKRGQSTQAINVGIGNISALNESTNWIYRRPRGAGNEDAEAQKMPFRSLYPDYSTIFSQKIVGNVEGWWEFQQTGPFPPPNFQSKNRKFMILGMTGRQFSIHSEDVELFDSISADVLYNNLLSEVVRIAKKVHKYKQAQQ